MKEKIIGILGGMGPEATADLFQKIINLTPAKVDQEHLRIIIDNNPKIPDRSKALLNGETSPLSELIITAQNLEKGGADFIIIPCNTAHFYYNEIQKAVNIPIIHMIQETVNHVYRDFPFIKNISLLATKGTYRSVLYQTFFKKYNIEILVPNGQKQDDLMKIIYAVKAKTDISLLKEQILKIVKIQIEGGAQAIIAGCTEIPLILKNGDISIPIIDPTLILAQKAVKIALEIS